MIQHAQVTPHFSTTVYPELLNNDEAWSNILSVLWGKALYKTKTFNILKCTFFLYQTENIWSLHCPNVQRLISEYPVISALKCLNFKTSQTPLSVFGKVQQGTVSPITEKKKKPCPLNSSTLHLSGSEEISPCISFGWVTSKRRKKIPFYVPFKFYEIRRRSNR